MEPDGGAEGWRTIGRCSRGAAGCRPSAQQRASDPLLILDRAVLGYDGTAVLSGVDLQLRGWTIGGGSVRLAEGFLAEGFMPTSASLA